MHFEIYQEQSGGLRSAGLLSMAMGGWRWRLKGGNGEIVASGESYTTEAACMNGIRLVMGTTASTPIYKA